MYQIISRPQRFSWQYVYVWQRRETAKKWFIMTAQENQQEENKWFKNKLMSSYFDLL